MNYDYVKGLSLRFLRGFVAGAIGAMAAVSVVINKWADVLTVLSALGLAALAGGITGGLMALDKYVRETSKQ